MENSSRQSVIVRYCQPTSVQNEVSISPKDQTSNFKLDIDCSTMNSLSSTYFGQEDCFYLEKLQDKFEETRSEISLGQGIVSEFIQFCEVRAEFSPAFWDGVSKQMRERYLNFVCSLDILDEIPRSTIFNLFKTNLAKAEMLTYVFVFNASTWTEELDFVWGKKDLQQWNARDMTINGTPFNLMVNFMPLPEKLKIEMFEELMHCCMPIFRDRTVLILMILLVIFDEDGNRSIAKIKENLLSILRRYLIRKSETNDEPNINNIINCVQTLPRLRRIFLDMKELRQKTAINYQSNSVA